MRKFPDSNMNFSRVVLLLLVLARVHANVPFFKDVTHKAGIDTSYGQEKKYGGPTVADLDSDGHPDLIFCHHDSRPLEMYFNNGDGTFKRHWFSIHLDMHGIVPAPISTWTRNRRFSVSVGGNYGKRPMFPLVYEVDHQTRNITDVTWGVGVAELGGRGRTAVYLDLAGRHAYWPDAIFVNAMVTAGSGPQQFGYENLHGVYHPRYLHGFAHTPNTNVMVADINGDGKMELVAYPDLKIYQLIGYFTFRDVTAEVIEGYVRIHGVFAVAEIDYDNDGDFDLYLARGKLNWLPDGPYHDILLENRNGRFVDVSEKALVPRWTSSHGVTVADFNNDGLSDLFVTQYNRPDFLLLNNGDGTFRCMDGPVHRPWNVRGDMAVGVDYDSDGLVDLISSQGDHNNIQNGGSFRIFKNVMASSGFTRYVKVRVGHAPDRGATCLHAVVKVVSGDLKMVKRVGSPGSSISRSLIDVLNFGLGWRMKADLIEVRWTSGYVVRQINVPHGKTIFLGVE